MVKRRLLNRKAIRRIIKNYKPAYLKIDVLYADEDEQLKEEFNIQSRKLPRIMPRPLQCR